MQQLFFVEPGRVEWRETERPVLVEPGDALVRPTVVATCDLDTGQVFGTTPFPGPFPLGHEGVGEVVAVGPEVSTLEVGQQVIIPFQVSCGRCARCVRGLTASCERVGLGAMYGLEPFGGPWGGFLSDLVRVPWADHMLVPLPDGVDPVRIASISDNIPDGWRTVGPHVDPEPPARMLVIAGPALGIPFYGIAIAKALGVERVDYLQFDRGLPGQDEKASRAGASLLAGPDEVEARSYPLVVCSAGSLGAIRFAVRAAEPDGTCVVNGITFDDQMPMPLFTMYTHGIRLVTGRVNARAVIPAVLDLVVARAFDPAPVTDAVVPWDQAADALLDKPQKLVFTRDATPA